MKIKLLKGDGLAGRVVEAKKTKYEGVDAYEFKEAWGIIVVPANWAKVLEG